MKTLNTVVIGTDFSACAESALDAARDFASLWKIQRIHVVSVVEPVAWASASVASAGADLATMAMGAVQRRLDTLSIDIPGVEVTREARLGAPARELTLAAEEQGAQLIITATHGRRGLERVALGSVSSDLIRVSKVPVLVIPGRGLPPTKLSRVLAAVDLSDVSGEVIAYAGHMASMGTDGRVTILSLFEPPVIETAPDDVLPHFPGRDEVAGMEAAHRQEIVRLVDAAKLSVEVSVEVLSKAPPSQVILDVASLTQAELIVIGTSGRNAWHRMIVGSTATRVLNEASCPILVIPHEAGASAPAP